MSIPFILGSNMWGGCFWEHGKPWVFLRKVYAYLVPSSMARYLDGFLICNTIDFYDIK